MDLDIGIILIFALVWGIISALVGKSKGINGFWYGFCLGFIGLIVVLCKKSKDNEPISSKIVIDSTKTNSKDKFTTLEKLHELKINGAITEEEYLQEKTKIMGE